MYEEARRRAFLHQGERGLLRWGARATEPTAVRDTQQAIKAERGIRGGGTQHTGPGQSYDGCWVLRDTLQPGIKQA